jgi:4-hydroxybenzoate adenylyltransferase
VSPPSAAANLAIRLADLAEREGWSDRTAFYEGHRAWTHGQVHDRSARAATVLAEHGVAAGDRVLIAVPDGLVWVTTFLAAARLGATAVLANPALTADEHRFMAEDSKAALCVSAPGIQHHFDPDRWLGADQATALTCATDCAATAAAATSAEPVTDRSPLYIQYTSGTTGRPKGVVHCHGDPQAYYELIGKPLLDIGPDDVTFSVSRLFFAYGFGNAFVFPLFSGSSAVLTDRRPTPAVTDDIVARHRVTVLYSVPSAYAALVDERGSGHRACFASVRVAVSAGEGLPPSLGERAVDLLGAPVLEQIGSTEAGHAFCANTAGHNTPGTVGRPVPGYQVELRDPSAAVVPDGAEGQLWVRGPTVTPGYLGLPVETERTLVDGWLATRDLARRNPDGTYQHLGRADDMEMVGGITVSPYEIEDVLRQHPAVKEVAVAALPDDRGATRLHVFVIPATAGGTRPDGPLAEDLIVLARAQLAPFKVPRAVHLVNSLPRTPTGKLRRHLVRRGCW